MPSIARYWFSVVLGFGSLRLAKVQDNYEIQVYGSDTALLRSPVLRFGGGHLRNPGELPLHEKASYWHSSGQHVSILPGESGVALLGHRRWTHLVYRNRVQLRGIPCTNNRSGGLICNRPRCDDGIRRLGRLHLERICQRSAGLSQTDSCYVHLLPAWTGIDRNRTDGESLARIRFHAETSRRRRQHQSRLGRGS